MSNLIDLEQIFNTLDFAALCNHDKKFSECSEQEQEQVKNEVEEIYLNE